MNTLAKALIVNTVTGVTFPVMYNPEEFTLAQGNNFAEVGIPGLHASPVQYVRGKTRTLSMELFFDTYESREDVRAYTGDIVGLLAKLPQTHAPPVLLFSMGRLQFQCVLTEAGQRFTMFLPDGTPVRCTMTIQLMEYVRVDVTVERGVFFGSPTASAVANAAVGTARSLLTGAPNEHLVHAGDTLSGLAAQFLGDPARWRDIAELNGIDDPLRLAPGTRLLIPKPSGGQRR